MSPSVSGGVRRHGSAAIVALLLAFAAVLLHGCAFAPAREEARGGEPAASTRRPGADAPRAAPPYDPGRPVRVLLGDEPRREQAIEAEGELRCWDFRGTLLRVEKRILDLSAQGERIRIGNGKEVDSPVDVSSSSGMRIGGKKISGRVRVSARQGRLWVVAVVPLEEYVEGVLGKEASPKFHGEALAALAVAVRTYAAAGMEKPKGPMHDVVAGVEDQVFDGTDGLSDAIRKAVDSTRGVVLVWQGGLARTVYHSTCGGRTENAKDAWGTDLPYLRSVACGDCGNSPSYRWDYRMTPKEAGRVALSLGVLAGGGMNVEITGRSATGRASRIRITSGGVSRETSAAAFRKAAGYARVKSLMMEIVPVGNGWVFAGKGYGHGVGMCQWGADGMARNGRKCREILARYYPGTSLSGEIL